MEGAQLAVTTIGYIQRIRLREIGDALRFVEPYQPADDLARIDVDNGDRVVSEFGDEQPPLRHIDRQVIDAASDISQGNPCFQNQW